MDALFKYPAHASGLRIWLDLFSCFAVTDQDWLVHQNLKLKKYRWRAQKCSGLFSRSARSGKYLCRSKYGLQSIL